MLHGLDESPADESLRAFPYLRVDLLGDGGTDHLVEKAFEANPGLDLLVCNVGSYF